MVSLALAPALAKPSTSEAILFAIILVSIPFNAVAVSRGAMFGGHATAAQAPDAATAFACAPSPSYRVDMQFTYVSGIGMVFIIVLCSWFILGTCCTASEVSTNNYSRNGDQHDNSENGDEPMNKL
jgi:hypothetical protein